MDTDRGSAGLDETAGTAGTAHQTPAWARELDRDVVDALVPLRETDFELRWRPRGRRDTSSTMLTRQQLALWIVLLEPGEWAVLELPGGEASRWA